MGSAQAEWERFTDSIEYKSNQLSQSLTLLWQKLIDRETIKLIISSLDGLVRIIDVLITNKFSQFIIQTTLIASGLFGIQRILVTVVPIITGLSISQIAAGVSAIAWYVANNKLTHSVKFLSAALWASPLIKFALIATAISFIIQHIQKLQKAKNELRKEVDDLTQAYTDNISAINDNIDHIKDLSNEYQSLYHNTEKTKEEQKRFAEVQNEIASIAPHLVQGYDDQGNAIISLSGNVDALIESYNNLIEVEHLKLIAEGSKIISDLNNNLDDHINKLNETKDELSKIREDYNLDILRILEQGTLSDDMGGGAVAALWDSVLDYVKQSIGETLIGLDTLIEKRDELLRQKKEGLISDDDLSSLPQLVELISKLKIKESEQLAIQRQLQLQYREYFHNLDLYINAHLAMEDSYKNLTDNSKLLVDALREQQKETIKTAHANGELTDTEMEKFISNLVMQTIEFSDALDNVSIQKIIDEIADLRDSGEDAYDEIEELVDLLGMTDIDADLIEEVFDLLIRKIKQSGDEAELSSAKIKKLFDSATSSIDLLTKAQDELNAHGQLSMKTMMEIADKHEELIIPMLEGEVSAREALNNAILEQEEKARDAFRQKVIAQLQDNEHFFNEILNGNREVWDKVGNMYGADQENFTTVANAKLEIDEQVRRIVGEGWAKTYGTTAEGLGKMISVLRTQMSNLQSMGLMGTGAEQARISAQIGQLEDLRDAILSISASVDTFVSKSIPSVPIALDKISSAAKSTSKALKDPYEEWLKVAEKTANEVVKLIQDAYRKQKKAAIAAKDEEIRIAKEAHDAKMYMLDEEYKAFERKIDQQLRALDDEASEEDFQRELTKLIEERGEIESEIAKLALDDSYEARAKIEELEKEKARVIENIEALTRNRSRTLRRQEIQDIRDDFRDEIQAAKDKETEIFNATSERLAEEKREIGYFYDELINDDRYYAQVREDIISGNLDNINAKLREFITDFKEINQEAAYDMGLSFQELLNIIDRANAAIREMHGLGAPPASTAKSTTTSTSGSAGATGTKSSAPKQTTTPVTTPAPVKTTTRPNGTQADYDKGYAKGYADGYHHLRKQTDFKNESIKYESGYNDGYTKGGYDGRSYTMMHDGGTVEEAHRGKVMGGGGRSKLARDMFSLFDEPLKPDEVLAKLRINEVVVEPSIGYPILSKNIANLLKSVAPSSASGNNIVNNINFRVARMDGTEKDARKFVHILAKGIRQEQQGMGQR